MLLICLLLLIKSQLYYKSKNEKYNKLYYIFKNLLIYAKKLIEIDKLNAEYNFKLAYALELNNNLDGSFSLSL